MCQSLCVCPSLHIGHCRTKVKVMMQLQNFSPIIAIQTVRSHNSTLVQANVRKLILSMFLHLILIYNIYEYRQA